MMVSFIDQHRAEYGVEPICEQLPIAPATYYELKAREAGPERLPPRLRRDVEVSSEIRRVYDENFQLYGARKVWRQLCREGVGVARCTVERLMRSLGLQGVVRGGKRRTTISRDQTDYPADLVKRQFSATRPNELSRGGFYLRRDVGRVRLRGLGHRCLLSSHHRLASGSLDAHGPGPGCPGAGALGLAPGPRAWFITATGAVSISRSGTRSG